MLSLTRQGCQSINIETGDPKAFEREILGCFEHEESSYNKSISDSGEDHIVVLLTDRLKKVNTIRDYSHIYSVKAGTSDFLNFLLNSKGNGLFTATRLCPKSIIVRLMGDWEKAVERISSDLGAVQGGFSELFEKNGSGTIISFTERNLNNTITLEDMLPISLFVEKNSLDIERHFRIHALEYLNLALGNRDWYELTIKIYDSYQNFDLHYKRLLYAVEQLGIGIILGETWGKDTASVFQSVGIYRVRLFTFMKPCEFKKILTGLEYMENGKRIVDMDLYTQKKKVRWYELRTEEIKDKKSLGIKYHRELFERLTEEQASYLNGLGMQAK